jgi:hypothetical protein
MLMPNKAKSKRKASKASKGTGRMTTYTKGEVKYDISCVDNAEKCIRKWLYTGCQENLKRAVALITKKSWNKNGHGYEFTGPDQILCELDTIAEQVRDLRQLVKSGYSKDYGTAPVTQSEQDADDGTPDWKKPRKNVKISA